MDVGYNVAVGILVKIRQPKFWAGLRKPAFWLKSGSRDLGWNLAADILAGVQKPTFWLNGYHDTGREGVQGVWGCPGERLRGRRRLAGDILGGR